MLMFRLMMAALLIGGSGGLAHAVEADWKCHQNGRYQVISAPAAEQTESIIVRAVPKGQQPACSNAHQPGDFNANPKSEPLSVIALKGGFLMLEEGPGDQRKLRIIDLDGKQTAYTSPYVACDHPIMCTNFVLRDAGLIFWRTTTEKPTPANCPGVKETIKSGWKPVIDEKSFFSFVDRKIYSLSEKKCDYRESL